VTSDLVICLRRVGCHDIVLERFSVEVGDRSVFDRWKGAAYFFLIEPKGYLGFFDGMLFCDTVNVSVYRSSWG
jgi:hypothetical protein